MSNPDGLAARPGQPPPLDLLRRLRALVSHHPFNHDLIRDENKCPDCKLLAEVDAALRAGVPAPPEPLPPTDDAAHQTGASSDQRP